MPRSTSRTADRSRGPGPPAGTRDVRPPAPPPGDRMTACRRATASGRPPAGWRDGAGRAHRHGDRLPGAAARDRRPVRPAVLAFAPYGKHMLTRFSATRAHAAHALRDGRLLAGSSARASRLPPHLRRRGPAGPADRRAHRVRAADARARAARDRRRGPRGGAPRAGRPRADAGTRTRRCARLAADPDAAGRRGAARPEEPRRHRQPLGRRDLLPAGRLAVDAGPRRRPARPPCGWPAG